MRIPRCLVVIGALAVLLLVSAQARSGPSEEPASSALSTLNAIRRHMGLPMFRVDARLHAAATAHSRYRSLNQSAGESFHVETRGREGYSSADPFERMRFHGYRGEPAAENGMAYFGTEGNAIEGWLAAPYHRFAMLHPEYRDIGLGYAGGADAWFVTANFGYGVNPQVDERPRIVCYPANGQTGVPTSWTEPESPNPLRIHRAAQPAGYVVSFSYFSGFDPEIRLLEAALKTTDGTEVACYLNHPGNDDFLDKNTILLIPKRPLAAGQTYRATVRAKVVGGREVERTWAFITRERSADTTRAANSRDSEPSPSRR